MLEPSHEQQEIPKHTLDPQVASALGHSLTTYIHEPLAQAEVAADAIARHLVNNKAEVDFIKSGIEKIEDLIENIKTSKQVAIVPGSWNFDFSPEKKPVETPPDTVDTDEPTTKAVVAAIHHFINNQVSNLSFAENIKKPSFQRIIDMIPRAQKQIADIVIEKFPIRAASLKFTTDEAGKTTIEPVLKKD